MNESTILSQVRVWALRATLVSAALVLLLALLDTWGITSSSTDYYSSDTDIWGKLQGTFAAIMGLSFVSLLTLLIASRVKSSD